MLHILWLIVKCILILLGILAGVVLLILMLILFCPVRYKGRAAKERTTGIRETEVSGEISWLFHGIAVKFFLRNGSPKMEIHIVGIPLSRLKCLFRRKNKKSHTAGTAKKKKSSSGSGEHEKSSKDEQKRKITIVEEPDNVPVEIISVDSERTGTEGEQISAADKNVYKASDAEELSETENLSSEDSAEKEQDQNRIISLIFEIAGKIKKTILGILVSFRRIFGIPSRIFKKIRKFTLTIKKFCGKINWYKEFIDHPRTREALSLVWKDAKKLVRHVLPTKITGRITFGCEDPSITGTVLAVLGMTIPFHKNAIAVNPLFDSENVLEGEIMLKGRIYGVILLKTAAELYFNKNIKYVIHRWRHKEVNHGERE